MANFCSRCGAPSSGGSFCTQCGAPLVDANVPTTGAPSETDNPYAVGTAPVSAPDVYVSPTAPEIPTNIIRAFTICMKKYCSFKGRASRSEYWYFVLAVWLITTLLGGFAGGIVGACGGVVEEDSPFILIIIGVVTLVFALPNLSVFVRRFHDHNLSTALAVVLWILPNGYQFIENGFGGEDLKIAFNFSNFSADTILLVIFILFIISGLFSFVVLVTKGTPGPNRFGEAPVRRPKR